MEELFVRQELAIEVRTPLHVGTDDRLREDRFVREGLSVLVLDEDKLVSWAAAAAENEETLGRFFTQRTADTLRIAGFFRGKVPPPRTFAAYRLSLALKDMTAPSPTEIHPFIKAPGHRPYLPGSSLKGAVRSGILRGALPEAPPEIQEQVRRLAREGGRQASEELQARLFVPAQVKRNRYSNYDLMRVLGFADTAPVGTDALQVYEVTLLSSRLSGSGGAHSLGIKDRVSLHVEALKPGTKLRGSLTWQNGLIADHGPAAERLRLHEVRERVTGFCRLCRRAAGELIDQEVRFCQGHKGPEAASLGRRYGELLAESQKLGDNAFLWPLGFGTGYDAKTVTDLLGDDVFEAVAHGYRHTRRLGRPSQEPDEWLGPELSPKSRKVVMDRSGRVEPMGWLRVEVRSGGG